MTTPKPLTDEELPPEPIHAATDRLVAHLASMVRDDEVKRARFALELVEAANAARERAEREREQLRACLAEATEMATDYHSACVAERADREKAERERDEARALLREAPVTRCACGGDCHDDWRARVAAALGREGT